MEQRRNVARKGKRVGVENLDGVQFDEELRREGAARTREIDYDRSNVGLRNIPAIPNPIELAEGQRNKSPDRPAFESSSSSKASSDESGFDEPNRIPPMPREIPIRGKAPQETREDNRLRTPPVDVEGIE
ncbi:hypothetical protein QAD02_001500 [Eretmocerus hayati]|uniref:Uncharacterized protein n=1 Tax=Eretmocerus hayati TaxID=131215 RepID=A0ACC2NHY6_9HYME|nr:hypothetical protein QAD02_001500 [Eretmocerus hayati]